MYHIDYLTLNQLHEDAPEWGSVLDVWFNPETGDVERQVMLGEQVEGSWSTSLRVRSSGGRVEVSGNPSKFGRLEAICGLPDLGSCVDIYNSILRELGLPEFTSGPVYRALAPVDPSQNGGDTVDSGARISRIDLTRNLVLGSKVAAARFLDVMEGQRWGQRLPFERTKGTTLKAGKGGRRRARVLYIKAPELLAHRQTWARSRSLEREGAVEYLQRCAEWADEIGLVRDEIRLGTNALSEIGYQWVSRWNMGTVQELFEGSGDLGGVGGSVTDYDEGIYDALLASGQSERMASQMANMVVSWMSGRDVRKGLSKTVFYRQAKIIRDVTGLDLRADPSVARIGTIVRPVVIEAKPLSFSDVPDWYDWGTKAA